MVYLFLSHLTSQLGLLAFELLPKLAYGKSCQRAILVKCWRSSLLPQIWYHLCWDRSGFCDICETPGTCSSAFTVSPVNSVGNIPILHATFGQSTSQSFAFKLSTLSENLCYHCFQGALSDVTVTMTIFNVSLPFPWERFGAKTLFLWSITKAGVHLPQKMNFTLLHHMGYVFLQNCYEKSCSKNRATLFFKVVSTGQWGTCSFSSPGTGWLSDDWISS